jgi:hypothetical protein
MEHLAVSLTDLTMYTGYRRRIMRARLAGLQFRAWLWRRRFCSHDDPACRFLRGRNDRACRRQPSSLGKEAEINEGLTIGSVDMIYTGPNFAERDYGPIAISDYPFMLKNYDHWKAYRDSDLFKELSDGYKEATGHTVMAITWYGYRHVTSNFPITKPDDMKGLNPCSGFTCHGHVPQRGGRQSYADCLCRSLSGASTGCGRRTGKPAADDQVQEVP